jgi:endonuclease/exonuclease/phosphatase family metal-dependent hydrolase
LVTPGIHGVKLLQLNAWGGRLEHLIGDLLEAEKPDIVCLQEAISYEGKESGLFISLEQMQEQYDLPYLSFGPAFSFQYMDGTARFGNAILSRQPITKTEVVFTHLEHKADFVWGKDSSNVRNFVHSVITIDGKPCNIMTHHGFWVPSHKNGNDETMQQMEQLADYVQSLSGPVVLTGDFNLSPDSLSLVRLNELLENLSVNHKLKTTRTQLTYKTEVCDYIFINEAVQVKRFAALDKIVSDHQALVLEFTI